MAEDLAIAILPPEEKSDVTEDQRAVHHELLASLDSHQAVASTAGEESASQHISRLQSSKQTASVEVASTAQELQEDRETKTQGEEGSDCLKEGKSSLQRTSAWASFNGLWYGRSSKVQAMQEDDDTSEDLVKLQSKTTAQDHGHIFSAGMQHYCHLYVAFSLPRLGAVEKGMS